MEELGRWMPSPPTGCHAAAGSICAPGACGQFPVAASQATRRATWQLPTFLQGATLEQILQQQQQLTNQLLQLIGRPAARGPRTSGSAVARASCCVAPPAIKPEQQIAWPIQTDRPRRRRGDYPQQKLRSTR